MKLQACIVGLLITAARAAATVMYFMHELNASRNTGWLIGVSMQAPAGTDTRSQAFVTLFHRFCKSRRLKGHLEMFHELAVMARSSTDSFLTVALLALGVITFCAPVLAVEPTNTSNSSTWEPTVQQWGLQELILHSHRNYNNPFQDVKVAAVFGCSGQTVKVDGFYDGEGTWKVRLMPTQRGSCTFKTSSKDTALSGVTGRFVVEAPSAGEHGPVQVAKTYHFDYADGAPYFPLGTTSYNWLNRDPELQEHTLAALRQTGFTKLRFGLFPKWYRFNRVDPPTFPFPRNAEGQFDFERFDPRFFANVEARIRELNAVGVQADVILFHPYDKWGFAKLDQAHNEAYLRYVVARLAAYSNVWWTMANEYDLLPPRDWDRLTALVHASDPYGHPVGVHNFATWYDHKKPSIDHVILQDGSPKAARTAAIARKRYHKPVVVDEYGYEGNNSEPWGELTGPEEVSRHWDITMAGAYASHGDTYVHPGGVLWWAAGGELDGESPARLAFLKLVMTSLPFQDMVPAPELVVNGTALAKPGEAYLFRVVWGEKALTIPPTQVRLAGAELFKVELIDPWRMKIYPLGYTESGDQAFKLPMVPALLRITAVAKGEGAPLPINTLAANFVGETPATLPVTPALFNAGSPNYSVDFAIGQLQQNPAANAVLEKYLPKSVPRSGFITVVPLDVLPKFMPAVSQELLQSMQAELEKIPVE